MNTPRSVRHQVSAKDGGMRVTRACTSQDYTALTRAAVGGHTACVQALVDAKAGLDIITRVSDTRLFTCPFSCHTRIAQHIQVTPNTC